MRFPYSSQIRYPVEFLLLAGLAISLPMFEGVKNVFWVLYARTWYVNRLRSGVTWDTLGGRWDGWDTLFAALLLTAPARRGVRRSPPSRMDGVPGHAADDVDDAWFLKRSGYGDTEWLRLHVTLQASVVVAVAVGARGARVSAHLRRHPAQLRRPRQPERHLHRDLLRRAGRRRRRVLARR